MPVIRLLLIILLLPILLFAQQGEGYLQLEDLELYYHTYGSGTPLLLLNGGPGFPSTHFKSLAQKLATEKRQVILFDQRGTGRSKLPVLNKQNINTAKMVSDIEALREHLGIDRWVVMGHSWGGMYAMLYATAHPQQLSGLILSASGGIDLEFMEYLGANILDKLGEEDRKTYLFYRENNEGPEGRIKRTKAMAPAYVYFPENVPKVVDALTKTSQFEPQVNELVFRDLYQQEYNLRKPLSHFPHPVIILQGRQDILGESTAYELHQAIPNSDMVLINECSHYLWLDQPKAYFSAIEKFWKELTVNGSAGR